MSRSSGARRASHLCLVTDDFAPMLGAVPTRITMDELTFLAEEAAIAQQAVDLLVAAIDNGDLDQAGWLVRKVRCETKSLCKITQGALRF